ncbi:hypothetical protein Pint_26125 [Pistacia integerrima]|uniref:Uncharacterized protein n=1 Tax=Pistacia integerrima TaxID=434235 RepID=A0ACC0YFZ3_9ROSI|nr:hypothetical protein Pint_26125 [Pistacia integerrima]
MPDADHQLTKLLGLPPFVQRLMIYQGDCFAAGTALRLAKDIAENNEGARVLVALILTQARSVHCSSSFRPLKNSSWTQSTASWHTFVRWACNISYPKPLLKKSPTIFFNVTTKRFLNLGSLTGTRCYTLFIPAGHRFYGLWRRRRGEGGGPRTSWGVLKEYGNMWSCSVLFILDKMRKRSMEEGKSTTSEGLKCGVLFAFGPGLTVETIVLRSFGL